jgi:hypothetical protein
MKFLICADLFSTSCGKRYGQNPASRLPRLAGAALLVVPSHAKPHSQLLGVSASFPRLVSANHSNPAHK